MKRRILLADDSVTIQKVIELTFMDEDYEVRAVSNGDEAIAALSGLNPDFVIADVHMPGANGYDVCRHVKQTRPDTPVLLLVGTFEPFDEGQARECGADSFLKKPFDSQDLLQRVEELISSRGGAAVSSPATAAPAATPNAIEAAWPEFELQAEPEKVASLAAEPARAPAWYDSPFPPLDEPAPAPVPSPSVFQEESPFQLEDDRSYASSEEPTAEYEPPAVSRPAGFGGWDSPFESPLSDTERLGVPETAAPLVGSLEETESRIEAPPPASFDRTHEPYASPEPAAAAISAPAYTPAPDYAPAAAESHGGGRLSDEDVDRIARRVVELLADRAVRDIAWEVVPDLAEVVIRDRLRELESQAENLA